MPYPQTRMRRMRRSEALRSLARETRLSRTDLVLPAFIVEGTGVREAVGSMPGVERLSAELPRALEEALTSIKRAGADWILTYAAKDVAPRLPA